MIGSSILNRCSLIDQEGFSLIEAMVAILIFAIGILGAYKLQIHATQGNALANRVSTATNWAEFAVEELLANSRAEVLGFLDTGAVRGILQAYLQNQNATVGQARKVLCLEAWLRAAQDEAESSPSDQ